MMPMNLAAENMLLSNIHLTWNPEKNVYLGLNIPTKLEDMYSLNYTPLLKKEIRELEKVEFTTSVIDWLGKLYKNECSSKIKKKIHFKFFSIPQKFFVNNLNSLIRQFI